MDKLLLIADRYRVEDVDRDLLGRGSMGDVYRATDTRTGEQIGTYLGPDHERNLASLRTQLDQAVYEAAWAKGQALTTEQVVELVMSDQFEEAD